MLYFQKQESKIFCVARYSTLPVMNSLERLHNAYVITSL